MNDAIIAAVVSAVGGALIGGLISFLVTNAQTRVMRGQLEAAEKQTQVMQDQLEAGREQARWAMMGPLIELLSRVLSRSALDDKSFAEIDSFNINRIHMAFSGPNVHKLTELILAYSGGRERYFEGTMSRDAIEQLRQETIQGINAIIAIPL